jgi:hypothetical protein
MECAVFPSEWGDVIRHDPAFRISRTMTSPERARTSAGFRIVNKSDPNLKLPCLRSDDSVGEKTIVYERLLQRRFRFLGLF